MKLRIRSLESKETLKIETPDPSSFQSLKDAVAGKISASAESLYFSLNRKDIFMASPTDCLTALGITSGDLIYYTTIPNGFSAPIPNQVPFPFPQSQHQHQHHGVQVTNPGKTFEINDIASNSANHVANQSSNFDAKAQTLESVDQEIKTLECPDVSKKGLYSVPRFLRNVYEEEVGKGNIKANHMLLIISVHAVFLESGFVCFDSVTKKPIDGFHLPLEWVSKPIVRIQYTLPDLFSAAVEKLETVDLKFQTMGKFLCVYGSLSKQKPVGFLRLDSSRFVSSINSICMLNYDFTDKKNELDESSKSSAEKEVFELWKIAKDGLALPLLIDLCDRTGLGPPPCFMRLPTDLKLKIMEFLPGVDIARVGCAASELRYLSSNNDLWKQKYMEEFSPSNNSSGDLSKELWKEKYVLSRERLKRKRSSEFGRCRVSTQWFPTSPPMRRETRPFSFFRVIGGDYDRFPAQFGSSQVLRFPGRTNFTHRSNFGGLM